MREGVEPEPRATPRPPPSEARAARSCDRRNEAEGPVVAGRVGTEGRVLAEAAETRELAEMRGWPLDCRGAAGGGEFSKGASW